MKQNQAHVIRNQLRERILRCGFQPGEKIIITDLCEEYGVSLGAVREALSGLEGEGLVVAEPKRGYQVVGISLNELFDLTEARIAIEEVCLRRSIAAGDLAWESRILAASHLLAHTPRSAKGDDGEMSLQWSEAHSAFHAALVSACKNVNLLATRRSLFDRSERYRRLSIPLNLGPRDVVAEHNAIAAATLARDSDEAVRLMTTHLSCTCEIVARAVNWSSPHAEGDTAGHAHHEAGKV